MGGAKPWHRANPISSARTPAHSLFRGVPDDLSESRRLPYVETLLTLMIVDGPLAGEAVTIGPGATVRVGRSKTADFFVMDPNMSRIHFILAWECDQWLVRDLSSRNGVELNGQVVEEAAVRDGDRIVAGFTTFQIRID